MMKLKLKRANLQKDADILFEIDIKSFNRSFDYPAESIDEVKSYLRNCAIYVCYDGSKPIASFSYRLGKNNSIELMQMMVLPDYQKKGVAKFMTKEFLRLTKGKKIYTVTHPLNTPAIILYLKFGFQIYGWKDNYYGDGQPRLRLKLDN
jgi:ribosomal protein S18 acetylase RimI-like enzyme